MPVIKDLLGQRFGRLVVIRLTIKLSPSRSAIWECICDCGNITLGSSANLRAGWKKSCGCLNKEMFMERISKPPGESEVRQLHYRYLKGARDRNLEFSITKDKVKELVTGNCFYCGIVPTRILNVRPGKKHKKVGWFKYNGIDRFDNTKGYTDDNIVSCCWDCNYAKLDMTFLEFKGWARGLCETLFNY